MKCIPTTSLTQPSPSYVTPPSPPPIIIPCPLSYEFQVVEYMTEDKVAKVELQYKVNQHDQYGNTTLEGHWTPVPRIKLPLL